LQAVPFYGKCNIKIIQIDVRALTSQIFRLSSQRLYQLRNILIACNTQENNISNSGFNNNGTYYGDQYELKDILLDGFIDFTITNVNNVPLGTGNFFIITMDIEYSKN
jgi:hypothetical protein